MKKWLAMVMPLIPMACSHAAETGFYFNLGAQVAYFPVQKPV
ncbi:hypothetical protein [Legionella shakespearei]|nr:hypothetical protein [Legionella shakespearei]